MLGEEEKLLEDAMDQTENERGHSSRRVDREIPTNNLTHTALRGQKEFFLTKPGGTHCCTH